MMRQWIKIYDTPRGWFEFLCTHALRVRGINYVYKLCSRSREIRDVRTRTFLAFSRCYLFAFHLRFRIRYWHQYHHVDYDRSKQHVALSLCHFIRHRYKKNRSKREKISVMTSRSKSVTFYCKSGNVRYSMCYQFVFQWAWARLLL